MLFRVHSPSHPTSAQQMLAKLWSDQGHGGKYNKPSTPRHDLDWGASWQTGRSIFSQYWKGLGPITGPGNIVLLTSALTVHSGSLEIKCSLEFQLTELPFLLSQPPVLLHHWQVMEEQTVVGVKLSETSMQMLTASKSAYSDNLTPVKQSGKKH